MEKILITGGAGFIGAGVSRMLLEMGHEVVVYDAFIQYQSPFDSQYQRHFEYRFKDIRNDLEFERGDTRNANDVRKCLERHKPDRVIHLAALPIADIAFKNPEEAISSILTGTVNVLDALAEIGCAKRFLYTSSSMVYGDFQYLPADEDHPKRPKDVYGGAKLAGEILTETYGRRYDIPYTIIRPSAVYGPTDINRRVSQIFIENAQAGLPLVLHGEVALDFTYIEDAARGFVLAVFSDEAVNETFNITRGQGRTLREYAEIVAQYYPDLDIRTSDASTYRPKRGALGIDKARRLLGYEPRYDLEQGLRDYVAYLRKLNGNGIK